MQMVVDCIKYNQNTGKMRYRLLRKLFLSCNFLGTFHMEGSIFAVYFLAYVQKN